MQFIRPEEHLVKLKRKDFFTHDVFELEFAFEKTVMPYLAGQFVMVIFNVDGEDLTRAYSIASSPSGKGFELCVKRVPGGKGSNFLAELEVGDELKVKGPYGMFTVKEGNQNDLLLVATGTGIAPIKGLVTDLLAKGDKRQIDVIFGVRYVDDIFYQEYFEELAKMHDNFRLTMCCSRPDGDADRSCEIVWHGKKGRVTDYLAEFDLSRKDLGLYVCGNGLMAKEVRQLALDAGMEKTQIHVESFG
jgi:ferredoxin-NADP reductase